MLLKNVLKTVQTLEVLVGSDMKPETVRLKPQQIREFSAEELKSPEVDTGIKNGNLFVIRAKKNAVTKPNAEQPKKGGE